MHINMHRYQPDHIRTQVTGTGYMIHSSHLIKSKKSHVWEEEGEGCGGLCIRSHGALIDFPLACLLILYVCTDHEREVYLVHGSWGRGEGARSVIMTHVILSALMIRYRRQGSVLCTLSYVD